MRLTPGLAVNHTSRRIASLLTSTAVAMTMFRLAAAHAEAERDKRRRTG